MAYGSLAVGTFVVPNLDKIKGVLPYVAMMYSATVKPAALGTWVIPSYFQRQPAATSSLFVMVGNDWNWSIMRMVGDS